MSPLLKYAVLDLLDDLTPDAVPADPVHLPLDELRDLWFDGSYAGFAGAVRPIRWGIRPRKWLDSAGDRSLVIPRRDGVVSRYAVCCWEIVVGGKAGAR